MVVMKSTGLALYISTKIGVMMSYKIRLGGTRDYVSKIDPTWDRAFPPGKVDFVEGHNNPLALHFKTMDEAKTAADKVWNIEGFHTTIDEVGPHDYDEYI